MRGYHGQVKASVRACRALGRDGVDCAQGAFHDYWISLRGVDDTERPTGPAMSPRRLCDGRLTYVRPCWYRYFIEQRTGPLLNTAGDIRRACRGLRPLQRSGCIGGASLALSTDPFEQTDACATFRGDDAVSCLKGVAVPSVRAEPKRQRALIDRCARFSRASSACYSWLGRTLSLVTDGRFGLRACAELRSEAARSSCRAGIARVGDPLVTFS
jgi:hypothetical protein